jgi:predicted DNA-binding protein
MSTSSSSPRKNYITGVSLEPEVVDRLDQLAVQTGLNRSWVLNTIVREYLRIMGERDVAPLPPREAIIKL